MLSQMEHQLLWNKVLKGGFTKKGILKPGSLGSLVVVVVAVVVVVSVVVVGGMRKDEYFQLHVKAHGRLMLLEEVIFVSRFLHSCVFLAPYFAAQQPTLSGNTGISNIQEVNHRRLLPLEKSQIPFI